MSLKTRRATAEQARKLIREWVDAGKPDDIESDDNEIDDDLESQFSDSGQSGGGGDSDSASGSEHDSSTDEVTVELEARLDRSTGATVVCIYHYDCLLNLAYFLAIITVDFMSIDICYLSKNVESL